MAIITCPECGRELTVSDTNRAFIFCRHCGTKIEIAASITHPLKQQTQKSTITPPPKDSVAQPSEGEPSAEALRHQHELEIERLRYEHELELERLRHENEMETERIKHSHTKATESTDEIEADEQENPVKASSKKAKRSSEPKGIAWHLGHFWKKHPVWCIIILIGVFQMLFGGTAGSSSSTASSRPAVNTVSATEHDFASSYNFSSAYTYTSDTGNTYYFLFDTDAQLVCFVSSATDQASISTFSGTDFSDGVSSVFHYSEGNYHRTFKYRLPSNDDTMNITESWKDESPTMIRFKKTDVATAETALNQKATLYNAVLPN